MSPRELIPVAWASQPSCGTGSSCTPADSDQVTGTESKFMVKP